ncbi:MAG: competence protein ComFB [Spirochaetales bacterium]|nr:competence protein ComFB [Spirochaetales bacterium]
MGLRDDYNFEYLVNEAERLVLDQLEAQLSEQGEACKCQDCILDMAAFALNNIRPLYRVSLMGTLYAKALEGSEYEEEVGNAVGQAIRRIMANPSH